MHLNQRGQKQTKKITDYKGFKKPNNNKPNFNMKKAVGPKEWLQQTESLNETGREIKY